MVTAIHRPTWVSVDLDAAAHNLQEIREWTKAKKVYAVLKADGYGLGAIPLAKAFQETASADALIVSNLDEALELRQADLTLPIWILGAWDYSDLKLFIDHDIVITIPSLAWLQNLPDFEGTLKVSLAIDTGMTRIGFDKADEISAAKKIIDKNPQLDLFSVYTHFATADEAGEKSKAYFEEQLRRWQELTINQGFDPSLFSMANSATCIWHHDDPRISFAAIRPGQLISGVNVSNGELKMPPNLHLERIFSVCSEIADVRFVKKDQSLSYGASERMPEDGYVATLPFGYNDGWLRRMQKSSVIINGKRMLIIGRITMDQTMVKLDRKYPIGTRVTLIGKDGGEQITVEEVANYSHTIVDEIQTTLAPRIKRIYTGDLAEVIGANYG
ncbi:alanine racemase [Oenococcus oeni]|uniref:alanine racemase n=1 Tax=Oenococcus oeni TaxID=1247 RepID=UPI0004D40D2A|nr:alanine racemase [Oenococcus oeni]KER91449.1 alanine racemase [Oenococcus oeni]KER97244.1 alanine racemase [Oenococcus oeni]